MGVLGLKYIFCFPIILINYWLTHYNAIPSIVNRLSQIQLRLNRFKIGKGYYFYSI